MALTALAPDAAVLEYSYTAGVGTYLLAGALSGCLPFSARPDFVAGATVIYSVKNGSDGVASDEEIATGIYNVGAKTLTRASIIASTNGGARVNWNGRTRLLVRPLMSAGGGGSIAVCATTPWDGADLVWQSGTSDWCPDSRVFGKPAPPGSNTSGGGVELDGAGGDGTGDGGFADLFAGTGGTTSGSGGALSMGAGDAGPGGSGSGGGVFINSGNAATGGNGLGGDYSVTVGTGRGTGRGGNIQMFAGDAQGAGGDGGLVQIFAGRSGSGGFFSGGEIQLLAGPGQGTGASGGNFDIVAGAGDTPGDVSIGAGTSGTTARGGDIFLNPGQSGGTGRVGAIVLYEGTLTGATPTVAPPSGFYLYVDPADGKLKVMGSAGTVTIIAVP